MDTSIMSDSSSPSQSQTLPQPSSMPSSATLLPQYGFGATYTFDALVEQHRFLYRVHTPKRGKGSASGSATATLTASRAASPSPRSTSPYGSVRRNAPASLSASVSSVRSEKEGDYFGFSPSRHPHEDEDDTAPGDPYFLSRKFKDDLTSPDPGARRRTISTLSTLSGGSGGYSFMGSDDSHGSDFDLESISELSFLQAGERRALSRSASMMLGHSRVRSDSLSGSRPGAKRSQSVDVHDNAESTPPAAAPGGGMTYAELVRHLDWTTRTGSPYVTTSFSFFFCLWEAVRRYKLGVKHDVEIAVIDTTKVRGRARTALEVLRSVEPDKQDKAFWKWYRFALESQDVLVFGAISGDAIYASIPLTQILPKLPSYFFGAETVSDVADPREPEPSGSIDPRSPTSTSQQLPGLNFPFFPTTPSSVRSRARSPDRDALSTSHLMTKLTWDIGTSLKRPSKRAREQARSHPGRQVPRHTSHAEFCKALSASFARQSEAEQIRDATTGAVTLAELLIEPWFRAKCAEFVAYPFRHDDEDEEDEDKEKGSESVCLGLAGDGCTLEHSHSHDSSIQDALFGGDKDEETEEEAARREAASVLSELALSLARWPSALWYTEHREVVDALVGDVIGMCVEEAARGMQGRLAWGMSMMAMEEEREREIKRRSRTISGTSLASLGSLRGRSGGESVSGSGNLGGERRGREDKRARSRSPFSTPSKHVRLASEDDKDHSPSPSRKSSLRESPYKPRARSPLGASPVLGPAIVIRPKSKPGDKDKKEERSAQQHQWAPDTPPPSPPLNHSLSEGDLRSASPPTKRKSPPPPPPPRSNRRAPQPPQTPTRSLSASALPSPNVSPSSSIISVGGGSPASSLLKKSLHRRAESIPGGWPAWDNGTDKSEGEEGKEEKEKEKGKEEGDVFWDPSAREQAKKRPVSWTPGSGSGSGTGAGAGFSLGAAFGIGAISSSTNSSSESLLRPGSGMLQQASPSSSPSSSIRRGSEPQAQSQTREGLLSEVVSSALGLGAGAVAAATGVAANTAIGAAVELVGSGSPLRLDTSSSGASSVSSEAAGSGIVERERERPSGVARHRRHSSHGVPLEMELSPVREVEQEDEVDAEEENALVESVESVESVEDGETRKGSEEVGEQEEQEQEKLAQDLLTESPVEVVVPRHETDLDQAGSTSKTIEPPVTPETQPAVLPQGTVTSTPRSERRRSRSSALEDIPEEDLTDWAIVEAPSFAEEYRDGGVAQDGRKDEMSETDEMKESEIPLPPSPKLQPEELEAESEEDIGELRKVPEITLSVDESPRTPAEHVGVAAENEAEDKEKDNINEIDTSHLSVPSDPAGPSEATSAALGEDINSQALVDSRAFVFPLSLISLTLRDQIVRTRAFKFLSTFFLVPVSNALRKVSITSPLVVPPRFVPRSSATTMAMPSPVFEDDEERGGVLARVSRFFSYLRVPFIHPESSVAGFFRRWRSAREEPSRSMHSILAPPSRWDAPILDHELTSLTGVNGNGNASTMMPEVGGGGGYWDERSTSWVVSCFVCGVTAALVLAAVQEHRCENYMLVANRYH